MESVGRPAADPGVVPACPRPRAAAPPTGRPQRLSLRGRPRVVSTWPHRVFGDATARRRRVDAECAAPMAALSAAGAAPDVLHCAQAPYATHVWRRAVRGRQNAKHPTPHMFGVGRKRGGIPRAEGSVLRCSQGEISTALHATHVWRRPVRKCDNAKHSTPHMCGAGRLRHPETPAEWVPVGGVGKRHSTPNMCGVGCTLRHTRKTGRSCLAQSALCAK